MTVVGVAGSVDDIACAGTTAGAVFGSTIACVLLVVMFGVGADKLELVVDC